MAITAYTGPPGAGKSHALVKDVILPAVMAGRRVVSNIDGLSPNAIQAYAMTHPGQMMVDGVDQLGEVVLFHGEDSRKVGFWPDEQSEAQKALTFVRPGDLVVFDEWAMFYPSGERIPPECNVEAFMRWHRHLTHPQTGVATDMAIATQSIADFHRRHRPLLTRSYLFKKLSAVGRAQSYTWQAFEGRLQKTAYLIGHGNYDPEVFPLYASSAAATAGNHAELKTNKKESIWSGWKAWVAIVAPVVLILGGGLGVWSIYSGKSQPQTVASAGTVPAPGSPATASAPVAAPPRSPWRIVGQIDGDQGVRVVVTDEKGSVRMLKPQDFQFDQGRAVSGMVDGVETVAEDRPVMNRPQMSPLGGLLQ